MNNRFVGSKVSVLAFGPARKVLEMMQGDFGFPIKDRMGIIPEVEMFRIKEDESIYNQAKTEKYDYHVMWDGEFVCFFNISEHPQRVRVNILKGLQRLIKEEKIYWDVREYERIYREKKDRDRLEAENRESLRKSAKTEEEKMVHEAFKRATLKKQKVKKVSK